MNPVFEVLKDRVVHHGLYGGAAESAIKLARGPVLDIVVSAMSSRAFIVGTPDSVDRPVVARFLKTKMGAIFVAVVLALVLLPVAEYSKEELSEPDEEDEETYILTEAGLPLNKAAHLIQALLTYALRTATVLVSTTLFTPLVGIAEQVFPKMPPQQK